jgi:hypothetical protein
MTQIIMAIYILPILIIAEDFILTCDAREASGSFQGFAAGRGRGGGGKSAALPVRPLTRACLRLLMVVVLKE